MNLQVLLAIRELTDSGLWGETDAETVRELVLVGLRRERSPIWCRE